MKSIQYKIYGDVLSQIDNKVPIKPIRKLGFNIGGYLYPAHFNYAKPRPHTPNF